jgi:hypothetical protein
MIIHYVNISRIYACVCLTALLVLSPRSLIIAQNLESIGKEKPLKVNGGISVNQTVYATSDTNSQRDPYNYYITGNLNLSLYGWSVPLSFNYSNQKTTFTQPFNHYSLHPQYKWVRLHLGYTSMSFSPYSLNGYLFLGAGIELTPEGPFSFSAMAGRLKKSRECDTLTENTLPPAYERWGYGFKAGYRFSPANNTTANLALILFHAKDKAGSLNFVPDSSVYPGENLVVGTNMDLTFAGHYNLSVEVSSSAVNRNTLSNLDKGYEQNWNKVMGSLIGSNGTTEFYSAYRLNANYNAESYSVGFGYERIDPGYETFGSYYFNNDMQNITLNLAVKLFEDKMNFSASIGRQNDNLDKNKTSELTRWVTAFNLGFTPNEKLNGTLSYSTFTSFMNIRSQFVNINELSPYDNLDTLNYTQLSATTAASVSYVMRNTDKQRQNISLNLNFQQSSEEQNGIDSLGASKFYNINTMYGYSMIPAGFTATLSLNTSISIMPETKSTIFGPSVSFNKLMLNKKLRTTLSFSYNRSYTDGKATNRIMNIRAGCGYRIGKHHNLSLNLTSMNRKNLVSENKIISDFAGSLIYTMSF